MFVDDHVESGEWQALAPPSTRLRALLAGMRHIFSQQRTLYITVITARPAERRRRAENLLAEHILPVQKQAVDWSSKLQAWNGERMQQADRALVNQFGTLQGSLSRV